MKRKKKEPKKKAPKRKAPKVKAAPVNAEASSTDQAGSEVVLKMKPEANLLQLEWVEDQIATAMQLAVATAKAKKTGRSFAVTAEVFDAIVRQTAVEVTHILRLQAPVNYGSSLKADRARRINP